MKLNHIYQGHVLDVLRTFPDGCMDTIITSPPYWGLRDYGEETRVEWSDGWHGQLGLEPTLDLYFLHLLQITAELKRVLKPAGVMFWNHGDCYGNSGGQQKGRKNRPNQDERYEITRPVAGIQKCLCLQNYRLLLKMVDEQGWILRNSIVWNKPNHMPSSVRDRFASSYEPVFMLVKKQRYWWDLDAVRISWRDQRKADIQRALNNHPGYQGKYGKGYNAEKRDILPGQGIKGQPVGDPTMGKNPGDVWTIPTQSFSEAHFATFPEKLIIPMIKSSCPEWICRKCGKARVRIIEKGKLINPDNMQNINKDERNLYERGWNREAGFSPNCYREIKTIGWTDCKCSAGWNQGIVLDPFMGSGTVAKVARKLHRNYIGIELSKEYIKIAKRRLAQGVFDL